MHKITSQSIRAIILQQSRRANVGHIGCALSVADIVASLYRDVLSIPAPDDGERDRFVVSKGHAALAVYAALFLRGWISRETIDTYCADGSALGVHPEHVVPGIDFSTGSLGQGLSYGAGAALAARLKGSPRRVFALLSDGECNEGAVWESVMFAAHHRLSNLTAIIDANGQQAFGYTKDVLSLSPMSERWRSFDWDVHEADGHDIGALSAVLGRSGDATGRPRAIIARTVFGKGVSFMENRISWHYLPMGEEEYRQAMDEVARAL